MDARGSEASWFRPVIERVLVVYALIGSMAVVATVGSLLAETHPMAGWAGATVTGVMLLLVLRAVLNRYAAQR